MKMNLRGFAIDLTIRTVIAFVVGIVIGLGILIHDGTLHDAAAKHAVAQTAGLATIWTFVLINAWWLPRLLRAEVGLPD